MNRTAAVAFAAAAHTPVPDLMEAEADDLLNLPMEAHNGLNSPPKRTRWDVQSPQGISLDDLTRTLAPLTGTMQTLTKRMEAIEGQVSDKVGQALDLIRTVDNRPKDMAKQIDSVQEAVEAQSRQGKEQARTISDIIKRLEFRVNGLGLRVWG